MAHLGDEDEGSPPQGGAKRRCRQVPICTSRENRMISGSPPEATTSDIFALQKKDYHKTVSETMRIKSNLWWTRGCPLDSLNL